MVDDRLQMIADCESGRFTRLCHDIADIKHRRTAFADRLQNFRNEEIREDRCIKASRPQCNKVCLLDCLQRIPDGNRIIRNRRKLFNPDLLSCLLRIFGNFRLPFDRDPVRHLGDEAHPFRRCRDDLAADVQDFTRCLKCILRIAEFLDQGSQEEIAKAVSCQLPFPAEAVLEELFQHGFLVSQSDKAVPEIARGNDAHFLTETSRGAAVVSHRYDG